MTLARACQCHGVGDASASKFDFPSDSGLGLNIPCPPDQRHPTVLNKSKNRWLRSKPSPTRTSLSRVGVRVTGAGVRVAPWLSECNVRTLQILHSETSKSRQIPNHILGNVSSMRQEARVFMYQYSPSQLPRHRQCLMYLHRGSMHPLWTHHFLHSHASKWQ